VIFTRDQPFGGRQLTEEIQKRYGLSYEDAERSKKQGGLPESYGPEVAEPFVAILGRQIARSLHFFRSSQPQLAIDRLILAGGGASIPGIARYLERMESVRGIIANPFMNMAIHRRVHQYPLSMAAPALVIATGLALRSFD
jgi:type IV pilus assembly protein PilM